MREKYNGVPHAFSKELEENDAFRIRLKRSSPKHVRAPQTVSDGLMADGDLSRPVGAGWAPQTLDGRRGVGACR